MAHPTDTPTVAQALVRRLKEHGVRHVFGYPGGQLTPLYDALAREPAIRHILARDEQAAAFMADGYARSTGLPGVCLAVCGPGVLNAATPLACSFSDSVPVLCLSGQMPTAGVGPRCGYYHENDQLQAVASFTKHRLRIESPANLLPLFDRAFDLLTDNRHGPVFVECPVDVLRSPYAGTFPELVPDTVRFPPPTELLGLAAELQRWKKPLLLVGGGVVASQAGQALAKLAERLGAPVLHTAMGKGALPADHPLHAGLPWTQATADLTNMADRFSPLFAQADGLLAIGCRFTQLCTGSWTLPMPPALAQIDIDSDELGRHYHAKIAVRNDARLALLELLARLPDECRPAWTTVPAPTPWRLPGLDLIGPLRRVLPRDTIVVADVTRLAYMLMAQFPVYLPRTFLHPAAAVAMGFGLPAALGARAAFPKRPIVCVIGDGGFQMCAMELATAVQEDLPVVIVLINDNCLTLIKSIQERRYEGRYLGVNLRNPNFGALAAAFGVQAWRVGDDAAFEAALDEALARGRPALIEVTVPKSARVVAAEPHWQEVAAGVS